MTSHDTPPHARGRSAPESPCHPVRVVLILCILFYVGWIRLAAADGAVSRPITPQGAGRAGFTRLGPDQTGILFTNRLDEKAAAASRVLLNGSGVATGDVDGDGLPDVFFCGLSSPSRLFRNLGGWRFEDATAAAGLGGVPANARGAVFADINGDGKLDLLVSVTAGGVRCYLNRGAGKFEDGTAAAGTGSARGAMTLALADVDGNGSLDLYVANNRVEDIRDRGHVELSMVGGKITVPTGLRDRFVVVGGQVLEYGEPDQLFMNDGHGRFKEASWVGGMFLQSDGSKMAAPPLDWGLSAAFRDINGDGAPDLYVCNDFWTPDRVWLNDGRGGFRAIGPAELRNVSASSMGVDFADVDLDGDLDFFVVEMKSRDPRLRLRQLPGQAPFMLAAGTLDGRAQFMRNTFYLNRGDGTFAEVANLAGLDASDWSWQPVFMDVDLDGYADLLVSAGHAMDAQDRDANEEIRRRQHSWSGYTNAAARQAAFTAEMLVHNRLYPPLAMPVVAFRNLGEGRFSEVTATWGTDDPGVNHGLATADLDGDGDLDFVVNRLGGSAGVFRNDTPAPRVAVALAGLPPNTQAVGARIRLLRGAVPVQSEEIISGGRYLSGSAPLAVFAAGTNQSPMSLEVTWRNGGRTVVEGVTANRLYTVKEPQGGAPIPPAEPVPAPAVSLFEDISASLAQGHAEAEFDDGERQPLLPRKLSRLGPGVSWFDLDGDGWDDLLVGGGRGATLGVLMNKQGRLERLGGRPYDAVITRDITTILGWNPSPTTTLVLAGSANYEDGMPVGGAARVYDPGRQVAYDAFPGLPSSTGPLAMTDIEGDGSLELFVGGRVNAGAWPQPANSSLFRLREGQWKLDAEASAALNAIGLVSGATWADLDGDGRQELVLALEWGPIRVFRAEGGGLRDITQALGLENLTGWWNSVAAGDLDGDGRLDLIAGNWGLNGGYAASAERPQVLVHGDISGRGVPDLVETEWEPVKGQLVPSRSMEELALVWPEIRTKFPTHRAFSESSLSAILESQGARAERSTARLLASGVFLNRGTNFEFQPFPGEAQWAPVFGCAVADVDGDGVEDVLLAQNFFATREDIPRLDAGRGLLLRGVGKGKLVVVPGQRSGLKLTGDQRGLALADFDRDGRLDVAVGQNRGATALFRNRAGKPGIRLRLRGPAGNPAALGAAVSLLAGERTGPVRIVTAGSGFWSQNSVVQVVSMAEAPTAIRVRWPGGRVTTTPLPAGRSEIVLAPDGAVAGP